MHATEFQATSPSTVVSPKNTPGKSFTSGITTKVSATNYGECRSIVRYAHTCSYRA